MSQKSVGLDTIMDLYATLSYTLPYRSIQKRMKRYSLSPVTLQVEITLFSLDTFCYTNQ